MLKRAEKVKRAGECSNGEAPPAEEAAPAEEEAPAEEAAPGEEEVLQVSPQLEADLASIQLGEETKNELWTTPQIFECNAPSPGVGYRHSPDFADKVVQTVAMCPCAFPVYRALSVVFFTTRCSTYVLYDWMLSCRSKHQTV